MSRLQALTESNKSIRCYAVILTIQKSTFVLHYLLGSNCNVNCSNWVAKFHNSKWTYVKNINNRSKTSFIGERKHQWSNIQILIIHFDIGQECLNNLKANRFFSFKLFKQESIKNKVRITFIITHEHLHKPEEPIVYNKVQHAFC